jgi:hypothetical protein
MKSHRILDEIILSKGVKGENISTLEVDERSWINIC